MKTYYLYYEEETKINYCFLFSLFLIAKRNNKEMIYNTIQYKNLTDLQQQIYNSCKYNISISTISRILKDTENYSLYFTKSKEENKIILNNNMKRSQAKNNKFITLTEKEILFLLEYNNKLLNKYYLYLKYFCGFAKEKKIDSTAD